MKKMMRVNEENGKSFMLMLADMISQFKEPRLMPLTGKQVKQIFSTLKDDVPMVVGYNEQEGMIQITIASVDQLSEALSEIEDNKDKEWNNNKENENEKRNNTN